MAYPAPHSHPEKNFDLFGETATKLRTRRLPKFAASTEHPQSDGLLIRQEDELSIVNLGLPPLESRALAVARYLNADARAALYLCMTPCGVARSKAQGRHITVYGCPELVQAQRQIAYRVMLTNLSPQLERLVRAPFIQRVARVAACNCSPEERQDLVALLLKDFPDFSVDTSQATRANFWAALFGVSQRTARQEIGL